MNIPLIGSSGTDMATTLFIKNMVCDRCILVVNQELQKLGLKPVSVTLGEVSVEGTIDAVVQKKLDDSLLQPGFERTDGRKARLSENIKKEVIHLIHHEDLKPRKFNWSHILADRLHVEYNYLSSLFSAVEGITLEQYIIRQ